MHIHLHCNEDRANPRVLHAMKILKMAEGIVFSRESDVRCGSWDVS